MTFAVGFSVARQRDNCIVWNMIDHKTAPTGGKGKFGFPDPEYFALVKSQLQNKGVTLTNGGA